MKTEDLMIGDWYYWEAEGKMYHYQATAEDFVKGEIPNFQPVPLTSEILEKNGWYFVESISSYRNRDNSFWIGDRSNPFGILISNVYKNINYVHELQHLLKMCKIDKEIVL